MKGNEQHNTGGSGKKKEQRNNLFINHTNSATTVSEANLVKRFKDWVKSYYSHFEKEL